MRSQTTPTTDTLPLYQPMSAYQAELFARQERARIIGELLAEAILGSWRLIQRIGTALRSRRAPARVATP